MFIYSFGQFPEPEYVTNDPRLGKKAGDYDGCTGIVLTILRYPDGYEVIQIGNEQTGRYHAGLTPDRVTIMI